MTAICQVVNVRSKDQICVLKACMVAVAESQHNRSPSSLLAAADVKNSQAAMKI
jgi:hypothetical protein